MRPWIALALVTAFVVAGCTSRPPNSGTDGSEPGALGHNPRQGMGYPTGGSSGSDGSGGGGTAPDGNGTDAGGGGGDSGSTNHPPEITRFVASLTAGSPPLTANFSFAATDADLDRVFWRIGFGDGSPDQVGQSTSDTAGHTYRMNGQFTVVLRVTDGLSEPVNQTLGITIQSGYGVVTARATVQTDCVASCEGCDPVTGKCPCTVDPSGQQVPCKCPTDPTKPTPFGPLPQWTIVCSNYPAPGDGSVPKGARGCSSWAASGEKVPSAPGNGTPAKGLDCTWFELPASAVGQPYRVSSSNGDPDIEFWSACSIVSGAPVGDYIWNRGEEHDSAIPAGAGCLIAYEGSFDPLGSTITFAYGGRR